MESDIDSDEDTETQLIEIEQLNKVLDADNDGPSMSETSSHNNSGSLKFEDLPSTSKAHDEYSKIEKALTLNKQVDDKLCRLEKVLIFKLRQCRQKIAELRGEGHTKRRTEIDNPHKFRYYNCGKPYFRDKSNFPAPDNEDTIVMAKSNMYDFSQVLSVPGWTVKDKSQFMLAIHKMSQELHKKRLKSRIAQIRRENKCKSNEVVEQMIEEIEDEIESLSKKHLRDIALPIDQDYDWDTIANKLNGRHTAQEYKALWKLFFHPSINKSSWSKSEHISLQEIAKANNLQDWDDIARKHNTGRTGYQTFVYYRTNMSNTSTGKKWTKEEVEYVKRLIDYYKEGNYIPWGKVAASMQNRTKIQIYNKYSRLIEGRKGRFLAEEDAVILHCVNKFGTNFRKIASYLPGRSITQLRSRYKVLSKMRVSAVWTVKEDKRLIQIMSNQDLSMNFSDITSHFPGKDRSNLRSRYLVLMKWMKKFPNVDIARAPRRGARRLPQGQASDDLMKALDNLKKRMQSEVDYKKSKKILLESSEIDIENGIVAALVNETIKVYQDDKDDKVEQTVCTPDVQSNDPENLNMENIKKILILLNSKLQKSLFMKSNYSKKYPALLEPCKEISTQKIKSYSRKSTVQTININNYPEIWGTNCLGPLNYVLPPQYATITGCRALMMHAASRSVNEQPLSLNVLTKRNCLFKEQMQCLMDRFYSLFVWPMLLSNEQPRTIDKDRPDAKLMDKVQKPKHGQEMPATPSVTMPRISECEKKQYDDSIDLDESMEKGNITLNESFSDESFI